jgi:hypothetical protein
VLAVVVLFIVVFLYCVCALFVCSVCYLSVVLLYYCHWAEAQLQIYIYIYIYKMMSMLFASLIFFSLGELAFSIQAPMYNSCFIP